MSTALFIGRFQPFHLGHLSVVKQALKETDYLIIGIGSAENSFEPENPFTAGERFEMIKAALDYEKIEPAKYTIIPIRNINNYALWCRHVQLLTPAFDKVYTGSSIVKELFTQEKKYKIVDVIKEIEICSTEIRKSMLDPTKTKQDKWEKYVHPKVALKIKQLNGIDRIKNISNCLKKS